MVPEIKTTCIHPHELLSQMPSPSLKPCEFLSCTFVGLSLSHPRLSSLLSGFGQLLLGIASAGAEGVCSFLPRFLISLLFLFFPFKTSLLVFFLLGPIMTLRGQKGSKIRLTSLPRPHCPSPSDIRTKNVKSRLPGTAPRWFWGANEQLSGPFLCKNPQDFPQPSFRSRPPSSPQSCTAILCRGLPSGQSFLLLFRISHLKSKELKLLYSFIFRIAVFC